MATTEDIMHLLHAMVVEAQRLYIESVTNYPHDEEAGSYYIGGCVALEQAEAMARDMLTTYAKR